MVGICKWKYLIFFAYFSIGDILCVEHIYMYIQICIYVSVPSPLLTFWYLYIITSYIYICRKSVSKFYYSEILVCTQFLIEINLKIYTESEAHRMKFVFPNKNSKKKDSGGSLGCFLHLFIEETDLPSWTTYMCICVLMNFQIVSPISHLPIELQTKYVLNFAWISLRPYSKKIKIKHIAILFMQAVV